MSSFDQSDGFDDFSLEQIGQHSGAFGGARLLKFTTDKFVTREGAVIGPERSFISLGLLKLVQKFVAKKLMESTVIPSGKAMPDIEKMNEKAPREEWGTDRNGNPVGPYVRTLVVKLVEELTLNRFAFVTSSIGGNIAVGDLSDKIKTVRQIHGPGITAVVSLRTTPFKTKHAIIKRPDFQVISWRKLGGEQLPKPEAKVITGPKPEAKVITDPTTPAAAPGTGNAAQSSAPRGAAAQLETFAGAPSMTLGTPVQPPKQEETGDEIPF